MTVEWERYFRVIIQYPIFYFCVLAKYESCLTDRIEFENLIKEVKQEYGSGFSKNYREMPEGEFVKNVIDAMELWMFIRKEKAAHQIKICPLTGMIQGSYPEDYAGGRNDE